MSEPAQQAYPLFNGLARPVMVMGVPLIPLMTMAGVVAAAALNLGLIWAVLGIPLWAVMALMCKHDANYFRLLWLGIDTRYRNRNKSFWQASAYTPHRCKKR